MTDFSCDWQDRQAEIATLFRHSFTESEGAEEGRIVSGLAADLMRGTGKDVPIVVLATEAAQIIGAAILTRMDYPGEPGRVMLLSPVAIHPGYQRRGIGQAMLRHGLDGARGKGADIVVTYGDPAYYGRLGFRPVSVEDMPPPYPLQQPQGWQAMSLTTGPRARLSGRPICAPALSHPDIW